MKIYVSQNGGAYGDSGESLYLSDVEGGDSQPIDAYGQEGSTYWLPCGTRIRLVSSSEIIPADSQAEIFGIRPCGTSDAVEWECEEVDA